MKLLTKSIKEKLLKAGANGTKPICKFFNPCGAATWVMFGMESDEDTLWGAADLGFGCVEFGTISLSELESVQGPFGIGIERDRHADVSDLTLEDLIARESLAGI